MVLCTAIVIVTDTGLVTDIDLVTNIDMATKKPARNEFFLSTTPRYKVR